ncbi:MAG: DUF2497 domain-containing protein [Rhodopseudomonas sp.]|uniref:PopZ family protein n=1 Tax=Rhodopseudomonas sp. TaxID=1078 RepID=UPI00183BABED|nr:DUF2497 domain-containing protein [Rhodopseudomonas sp.]NVN86220.1 DUF2497 domain-containing protein [Rhodopseudomonas sp.]
MTQPAKVQEPSMEEILASIRRIIADDEAKPVTTAKEPPAVVATKPEPPKAVTPVSKVAAMTNTPAAAPVKAAAAAKPVEAPAPPPPAPAAVSNNQDDIDALLAGLDATTTEEEVRPPLPDGDVFELTDEMALPDPPPPNPTTPVPQSSFQKQALEDDVEFAEFASPKERNREPAYEPPAPEQWAPEPAPQQILSRSTVTAVESAFNSLANTVLSNNARTLEDLVKEMLRPMLKSWLDDNLPTLVERIVKAEIERVSRGR